ncbi:hypothetical protein B484DRAFT_132399 [Ochromonadaceae sp. CCMP2298]|nr:hypothetical protein B484DRAFT_132399 [Ochromonadaceae sp. CCMP2298]
MGGRGDRGGALQRAGRVDMLRLFSGLAKLGIKWGEVPCSLRGRFVEVTQGRPLDGRELPSVLYLLGQLGATAGQGQGQGKKGNQGIGQGQGQGQAQGQGQRQGQAQGQHDSTLPAEYVSYLLRVLASDSLLETFTAQGLCNAVHGLARLELRWEDLATVGEPGNDLRGKLFRRAAVLLPEAGKDDLCPLLQSLGVMRARWEDLPRVAPALPLVGVRITLNTSFYQDFQYQIWSFHLEHTLTGVFF